MKATRIKTKSRVGGRPYKLACTHINLDSIITYLYEASARWLLFNDTWTTASKSLIKCKFIPFHSDDGVAIQIQIQTQDQFDEIQSDRHISNSLGNSAQIAFNASYI